MSRPNRRRLRHYLIHGDLQLRFMSSSLIYILLTFLVIVVTGFYPVFQELFLSTYEPARYEAAQAFLGLFDRLLPAFLVIVVLCLLHMLVVSHRIAGPLAKFDRAFNALAEGRPAERVALRRSDYLQLEGRHIDRMIEALAERDERLRRTRAEMDAQLALLQEGTDDPHCRDRIEALRAALRHEAPGIAPAAPAGAG